MRQLLQILFILVPALSFGQPKNVLGTFTTGNPLNLFTITFNADSTFVYRSDQDPVFLDYKDYSENGRWRLCGDTIILNPQLPRMPFVQSDFQEQENLGDSNLSLTFNDIKRYFDPNGNMIKSDTSQFSMVDFVFNRLKRRRLTSVVPRHEFRCTFSGPIPREIITTSRTISIKRPAVMKSIFVSFAFVPAGGEFMIKDPNSNHFVFNVFSNYYQSGQLRQRKLLIKNENVLYTKQKDDGEFEKDNIWTANYDRMVRLNPGD